MSIIIRLQNLPLEANSLDIRRFFHGLHIPDGGVHIVGGDQGDAFIAFGSDEDARRAMGHDGNSIKGSKIKLLLSSRNEMQRVIELARSQTMVMKNIPGNVCPQPNLQQNPSTSLISNNPVQQLPPVSQPPMPYQQQTAQAYSSNSGQVNSQQSTPQLTHQQGYYNPPQSVSNQVPPVTQNQFGITNNQSSNERSYRAHADGHGQSEFRSRSRSRSRSPPKNCYMYSGQNPPQVQTKMCQNTMHTGLMGSLAQQPPSHPSLNQSFAPSNSSFVNHPTSGYPEQPPPLQSSSYGSFGNNLPPYPSQNNTGNELIGSKYERSASWNQSNDAFRSTATGPEDDYRKVDPMHQQHHSSITQTMNNNVNSPNYGGYGNNNDHLAIPQSIYNNYPNQPNSSRVFTIQLLNLPFNVSNIDLIQFFHPLTLTEDNITLLRDSKGYPSGIGLVKFSSHREFETALGYNNGFIRDRKIQVCSLTDLSGSSSNSVNQIQPISQQPSSTNNPLMPTPQASNIHHQHDPYRSENYPPYRNIEDNIGYNHQRSMVPPQQQFRASPPGKYSLPSYVKPMCKDYCLYMKGLPYSNCTTRDVAKFFEPIKVYHIDIESENRKPTGNAFVEFRDRMDFDRAMEYNMRHMGRRYIELLPVVIYEKFGPNYHMPNALPPPRRGSGPSFNEHPQITYCVSVRGLSKHVTSKNLKSYFAKGNAETYAVHIMLTKDRLNAGEAFLEFINKENQHRALELDGSYIGNDRITVRHVPYEVVRQTIPQPPPSNPGHSGPPRQRHSDYRDSKRASGSGGSKKLNNQTRNSPPPFLDKTAMLIVKNLSQKVIDDDLCSLFKDYDITRDRIRIRQGSDNNGDQTLQAHVSFHSKSDAEHAQRNMDKKYCIDRKVHILFA